MFCHIAYVAYVANDTEDTKNPGFRRFWGAFCRSVSHVLHVLQSNYPFDYPMPLVQLDISSAQYGHFFMTPSIDDRAMDRELIFVIYGVRRQQSSR